jgi:hypothetical protein
MSQRTGIERSVDIEFRSTVFNSSPFIPEIIIHLACNETQMLDE